MRRTEESYGVYGNFDNYRNSHVSYFEKGIYIDV